MPFNLGTIWAEVGLNTKKLDEGLMKAQTKLAAADKQLNTMSQKLSNNSTKLLATGGAIIGVVAGIGAAAIKSGKEFETSMRNVNSIAKLSEKEFADLSDDVIKLSTKLPQSAKVLADGLYDISSSGFAGADGLKVLEAAAKAASAGMTDTATSAKGITAVLNAYGLEADKAAYVSDTMFKTVDKGVITFEELSSNIGEALSTANLAKIDFNELSGTIAYMTTKGIGAAEAFTAWNRLVLSIIDPTSELAEVLKKAGYETGEAALKAIGLTGVLDLMEKATSGSLTELQKMTPEMRALKATGALLGDGIQELNGYMNDFKDTTGATNTALAEQSKALNHQIDILKNNLTAIGISLGSEFIPKLTEATTKLSEYISANNEAVATNTKFAMEIAGVLGGLVLFGGAWGQLIKLMGTAGGQFGIVIAAFATLNIAVDFGAKKLEEINHWAAQLGATLVRMFAPLTAIIDGFKDNITIAKALADGYLSVNEAGKVNIFTMKQTLDVIQERIEADKKATDSANKYSDAIGNIPKAVKTTAEFDASEAQRHLTVYQSKLASLGFSKGGIVGYATGGIIGLPKADYGAVVPQTGRAIPILAHEGEVILNSSQQANLAQAIWGVANGRSEASQGQPINITVLAELDGEVIYKKTEQYIHDSQKTKLLGQGVRI